MEDELLPRQKLKALAIVIPEVLLVKFFDKCEERDSGDLNGIIEALRDWIDKE